MSQSNQILEHLKQGHSITVTQALSMFGCYALSQRIGDLKRQGHNIVSKMIKTAAGKRVASYRMVFK
jgi:Helix-turn-helix domain